LGDHAAGPHETDLNVVKTAILLNLKVAEDSATKTQGRADYQVATSYVSARLILTHLT
jgi:hypothetical protein